MCSRVQQKKVPMVLVGICRVRTVAKLMPSLIRRQHLHRHNSVRSKLEKGKTRWLIIRTLAGSVMIILTGIRSISTPVSPMRAVNTAKPLSKPSVKTTAIQPKAI